MGTPSIAVLDTHSWIWWNEQDRRLSRPAADFLLRSDVVAVPAIAMWEVALLVAKGRLTFKQDLREWFEQALQRPQVVVMPLVPSIALRAANLGPDFHRDPMDRLIVATALELGASLVTVDSQIRAFAGVETVW